jgi:hypothetical protein
MCRRQTCIGTGDICLVKFFSHRSVDHRVTKLRTCESSSPGRLILIRAVCRVQQLEAPVASTTYLVLSTKYGFDGLQ